MKKPSRRGSDALWHLPLGEGPSRLVYLNKIVCMENGKVKYVAGTNIRPISKLSNYFLPDQTTRRFSFRTALKVSTRFCVSESKQTM